MSASPIFKCWLLIERADLLPDKQPDRSGCSVSLTELKDWLEGYGPKKTDDLELPEPSE